MPLLVVVMQVVVVVQYPSLRRARLGWKPMHPLPPMEEWGLLIMMARVPVVPVGLFELKPLPLLTWVKLRQKEVMPPEMPVWRVQEEEDVLLYSRMERFLMVIPMRAGE